MAGSAIVARNARVTTTAKTRTKTARKAISGNVLRAVKVTASAMTDSLANVAMTNAATTNAAISGTTVVMSSGNARTPHHKAMPTTRAMWQPMKIGKTNRASDPTMLSVLKVNGGDAIAVANPRAKMPMSKPRRMKP